MNNGLNEQFHEIFHARLETGELQVDIPETAGAGSCRRIRIRDGIDLHVNDMILNHHAQIEGRTAGPVYSLLLCLADDMNWEQRHNRSAYQIRRGEGLLYALHQTSERGEYAAGRHYKGVNLLLNPDRYGEWVNDCGSNADFLQAPFQPEGRCFTFPMEARLITEQILRCPYRGMLKRMYLEAKVLEMTSVCLHETDAANAVPSQAGSLTRSDLDSLRQAKAILDSRYASPPTIAKLARAVQINECKLKRGFKQLFGMPVYAYVLERRMVAARYWLEVHQMRVGQVALQIGYASSQHFTRAFHKKFGCNPSDYLKRGEGEDLTGPFDTDKSE